MITLQFEPQEMDYVFKVLTQRPWGEVNVLLNKMQQQIQQQQNPPPVQGNGKDETQEARQ